MIKKSQVEEIEKIRHTWAHILAQAIKKLYTFYSYPELLLHPVYTVYADIYSVGVILYEVLTGKCPVHTQLLDRTDRWTEEFRGIAASLGDIWLEKVRFLTSRKMNLNKIVEEDTPVAGLLQSIKTLKLDNDALLKLVPELNVLKNKLPAEMLTAQEPFLDTSPEKITELCAEVEELLTSRLLHHGGSR